jgi:hypothetical protein
MSRKDQDLVPESAYRASHDNQDYHTGRGGAGNEHVSNSEEKHKEEKKTVENGGAAPISLADKLKHKLFGAMKK